MYFQKLSRKNKTMDPRLRGGDEYLKLPINLRNVTPAGDRGDRLNRYIRGMTQPGWDAAHNSGAYTMMWE